jgi:hypothetical protein
MKKAKATRKSTASKPAKKRARKSKKEINLAEVRKDIAKIVGSEVAEMTHAIVDEGLKGQLAPVKYLFEVSGIYPATPGTAGGSEEDSLAHRLLKHLGLPTTPVVSQEDELRPKTLPATSLSAGDCSEAGKEGADEESGDLSDELNPEKKSFVDSGASSI